MKKIKMIFIFILIISMVSILFFNEEKIEYIMKVGDMEVAKEEIIFAIDKGKLGIKNNLIKKHQIEEDNFNWNKKYGNKYAIEYLEDYIINEIKYDKLLQKEAIEAKILKQFNYSVFLEMFEEENDKRQKAIENDEVVYGLKQYTEKQYYDYINSNLYLQLKDYFIDTGKLKVTDDEILKAYENNKDYFGNENLINIKDNVKQFCYDDKFDEYLDLSSEKLKISYDEQKLEKIIKEQLK